MANVFTEVYGDAENDSLRIAGETMIGDLVRAIIDEIKAAPAVWQMMSERTQEQVIARVERQVVSAVEQCVHIIAAGEMPTIEARLEQITTKDCMKAVLLVSKNHASRHELMDSTGQEVLIVLPNKEQYTEQISGVTADPDQPGLALVDDDNKDPLLDDAIQLVTNEKQCSIAKIQRELRIGYNRAARMVDAMENLGIVSAPNHQGVREVYPEAKHDGDQGGEA